MRTLTKQLGHYDDDDRMCRLFNTKCCSIYSRFLINFSNLRILLDSCSALSDKVAPAAGLDLSSGAPADGLFAR